MKKTTTESWKKLCDQAAKETDSDRLIKLVKRINDLLHKKNHRISGKKHSTRQK